MELGNFSISLAVKDLAASQNFYTKFGFKPVGGDADQGWLVLQNNTTTIGLFQGMFEENILTFNPGWNSDKETLENFTDIRDLQKNLKSQGVTLLSEADETTSGPASFMVADPDGNTILIDQHV